MAEISPARAPKNDCRTARPETSFREEESDISEGHVEPKGGILQAVILRRGAEATVDREYHTSRVVRRKQEQMTEQGSPCSERECKAVASAYLMPKEGSD